MSEFKIGPTEPLSAFVDCRILRKPARRLPHTLWRDGISHAVRHADQGVKVCFVNCRTPRSNDRAAECGIAHRHGTSSPRTKGGQAPCCFEVDGPSRAVDEMGQAGARPYSARPRIRRARYDDHFRAPEEFQRFSFELWKHPKIPLMTIASGVVVFCSRLCGQLFCCSCRSVCAASSEDGEKRRDEEARRQSMLLKKDRVGKQLRAIITGLQPGCAASPCSTRAAAAS